jgi:hypothetical protein
LRNREGFLVRKIGTIAITVTFVWLLGVHVVWAQKYEDKEHAELAKALNSAKVSLAKGLSVSEREGTPISGKFEVEDGKLQLSVYTMKGDKFFEVIVDHKTGKIAKADAITGGEDLAAAKAQSEAMTRAKLSLGAAIDKAVKGNKGYRPVSVVPALRDGHPEAEVTLVKGKEFKTITAKLD